MTYSRLSDDAKESRKEIPKELQGELLDCLEHLCENPENGGILHGTVRLYEQDDPAFEITYTFDEEKDTIDFLHLSAPVLQVARSLFVSYSHDDDKWLKQIVAKLEPLEALGVKVWVDTDLEVGEKWEEVLTAKLHLARAAVLLVSNAFLESEYIRETELPLVLSQAGKPDEGDKMKILWIPISRCDLAGHPIGRLIGEYQAVVDPELPLEELEEKAATQLLDEILRRIATAIKN